MPDSRAAIIDSVNEWCELFRKQVNKHRANEIIDAVNAMPTDHATIIVACTHLLGGLLAVNDDPHFLAALMSMVVQQSDAALR
jgi:hypothetical protein